MEGASVETSYKGRQVEGFLDLQIYRPLGYRLALACQRLGMSPAQVTLCGTAIGVIAGHFYFYRALRWNLLGMFLQILCNLFDNADGQLARLTKSGSRAGRALDGLGDNLVYLSIYLHLGFRLMHGSGSALVWLLVIAAAASHSLQSAAADYLRNAYLYFVEGRKRAELDSAATLKAEVESLSWRKDFTRKFLLRLYLNFTNEQEMLAPRLKELCRRVENNFPSTVPNWLQRSFHDKAMTPLRWSRLLMNNTRMGVLFLCLVVGRPGCYLFLECTLLNLLLGIILGAQSRIARQLLPQLENAAAVSA